MSDDRLAVDTLVRRLRSIAPAQPAIDLVLRIDAGDWLALVERCNLPRDAFDGRPLGEALADALDQMGVPQ